MKNHKGHSDLATLLTNKSAKPAELTVDEARQGVTGHNVRYILLIFLTGALIVAMAAWAWTGTHH